ncbi:Hpt domain-containing protein [Roseinatronobacter sp. S2]|uniref:Hpt domain-containing protein n=1 Tax=Roseinatronobacter sp. S2 TaxID=3035471 RepID=UPI002410762E|nr:Hpt domain-containing protein [Roseinatronobacter sp. S2]WFE76209.1 hypothetical protein P8S53_07340 [Roseinatronobacter sp. S2]
MTSDALDRKIFLALLETGGSDVAAALAEQLTQDFARLHSDLQAHLSVSNSGTDLNFQAIYMIAHEMKGLALTIGAVALPELSLRAEKMAQNKDGAALAAALPEVIDECDRVRTALAQFIENM